MVITRQQLTALFPRAAPASLDAFAKQAPDLFARFGIDATPNRLHYFLAQIGHESGGLTVTEEKLGYSAERLMAVWPSRFPTLAAAKACANNPDKLGCTVYAGRLGNGDVASGDGYRYRGRGYIQITGKANYRDVGTVAGIDLVAKPDRAGAPADALLVACAYWKMRGLNAPCDAGDFTRLTRLINGGTIGMDARRAWLDKVRAVLAKPPAKQPDAATARAVQLALIRRGFTSIGAADGVIGARTAAAIHLFRTRNGLGDGMIDDRLLKVLEIE